MGGLPPEISNYDKNAWYDNPNASTPYKSIGGSARWGKFVESVVECKIGHKVESPNDAKSYVSNLIAYMREMHDIPQGYIDSEKFFELQEKSKDTYVYLVAVPING